LDIKQDTSANKFIGCEGSDCGYISYEQTDNNRLRVLSTFVPEELRGGGRAATLTRHVLDYARANELTVEPVCSYTQLFMKRNKAEYGDLL